MTIFQKIVLFIFVNSLCPFTKLRADDSFFALPFKREIHYDIRKNSSEMVEPESYLLVQYLSDKCQYEIEDNMFLFSILHEIGHIKTDFILSLMKDEYCDLVDSYSNYNLSQIMFDENICNSYFDHPVERAATDWALSWIGRNPKKVKLLSKIFPLHDYPKYANVAIDAIKNELICNYIADMQ